METFSVLLAICEGNSLVPREFPTQRPVMQSFDIFFDLCLNQWLSNDLWGWWFETLPHPLWRHCNGVGACLDAAKTDLHHLHQRIFALVQQLCWDSLNFPHGLNILWRSLSKNEIFIGYFCKLHVFKHGRYDDIMVRNTSSIIGILWGESTSDWWIPLTMSSDAEFWCWYLPCQPHQSIVQTVGLSMIWDTMMLK